MLKDKKAFIFYFLMSLILTDFGNQIRKISYLYNFDNPLFSIVHVNNTGGAFSLFQNHSTTLAVFGIIILIFLIYYTIRHVKFSDKIVLLSLTLFSSGVLGNVIERLKYGYVIDYIKLNFIDFPIFNMFDIMICTRCFLYIIFILFFQKEKNENNS